MIRGAVLGGDVSKSRSPVIHEEAFRRLGIEGTYGAFSIDARGFRSLIERLAGEGYDYVNVTIPHKRAAAELAHKPSKLVRSMTAANTLIFDRRRRGVRIRAENTDGYGLLAALRDLGVNSVADLTVVMVGSGGAAAGALAALVAEGASVRLLARRRGVALALRRRLPARVQARVAVSPLTAPALADALRGASVLISAVPASAWDDADARAGLAALDRRTAVLEMAYGPRSTLAARAAAASAPYQDGLPMLVHQAARAVELVTGHLPPAPALLAAAKAA